MPNPGVVKSEMSGVKCQVSCYDIAGCDLSFGTWLTTTTRAKRRCRERPLQCCRRPLSPMTPFSRRKQSEPVDPPHSYRPCTLRAFRARRILPKILKENDIRRSSFRLVLASEVAVAFALLSPVPSASSIGICERQQPWGRVPQRRFQRFKRASHAATRGASSRLPDQHWAELFAVVSSRMPPQRSFPTRLQLRYPLWISTCIPTGGLCSWVLGDRRKYAM